MIIDIHAHAFPDAISDKALDALTRNNGDYKPVIKGSLDALLTSMNDSGVDVSCIANIATKPSQVKNICSWSAEISSDRILPLGSVFPKSPSWEADIDLLCDSGFSGIKLHPMYQNFNVDDKSLYPFYEKLAEKGLFVFFHAGYDIAFGKDDNASPRRFAAIRRDIPPLKIALAHLGGWHDWDAVFELLAGGDYFFDTSFMHEIEKGLRDKIISKHGCGRIIFGTDSPWVSQKFSRENVEALDLSDDNKEKIFSKNVISHLLREARTPL